MTVDSEQNVTSQIWAYNVGTVNLPIHPGQVLTCMLCLEATSPGTARYILANETNSQKIDFKFDTGFPPAVTISAGVTRDDDPGGPLPLARFGTVYFDDISAYTVSGDFRSLTLGNAITMVDRDGRVLARPVRLNESAFKTEFVMS
jgi:hypothetical protein